MCALPDGRQVFLYNPWTQQLAQPTITQLRCHEMLEQTQDCSKRRTWPFRWFPAAAALSLPLIMWSQTPVKGPHLAVLCPDCHLIYCRDKAGSLVTMAIRRPFFHLSPAPYLIYWFWSLLWPEGPLLFLSLWACASFQLQQVSDYVIRYKVSHSLTPRRQVPGCFSSPLDTQTNHCFPFHAHGSITVKTE